MSSVKVAVRVRPFNKREIDNNSECCIKMAGKMTSITDPSTGQTKKFYFDYSYWSHDGFMVDPNTGMFEKDTPDSNYASQTAVFSDLGVEVLDNAFEGYHTCLFAYGQTGSGKSYSIFGYEKNIGIIPMACAEIFRRIELAQEEGEEVKYSVTISMLEIYNECVQDLFVKVKRRPKGGLKIREMKSGGVYVEDLTSVPVNSYDDIADQIEYGTTNRTIGATNMNATSSRAHTVTTITFKQTFFTGGRPTNQKESNINLVDLAGSERQRTTGADAERLKEGSNINKSLSFLGKVISILADKASGKKGAKDTVVPYRESKLTRMLQNALGGNSKTAMIAALSPASINYEETYSTLQYANQVKAIKNQAKVNENPQDKLIRELKEENERLKQMMERKQTMKVEVKKERKENQEVMSKIRIMNVSDDPMLTGQIHHAFKDGINLIGRSKKGKQPDIPLNGLGIVNEHNKVSFDEKTQQIIIHPNSENAKKNKTYLNGELLTDDTPLKHGDQIIFGNNTLYIVIFPGMPTSKEMMDYEAAINVVLRKQMLELKDAAHEKEMNEKLNQMKHGLDKQRKEAEEELMRKQREMEEARKKLEDDLKRRDAELQNKIKEVGDDKKKLDALQEKLKKEKEDAERLRKLQEDKEKQLEEEMRRAMQAFEEAQRKRQKEEFDINLRAKLEAQLSTMILMCNDANEYCRALGRLQYFYKPSTEIEILPDGTKVPKVVCKAYPDRKKDYHITLDFEEFQDKLDLMNEKYAQYMISVEEENNFSPELEVKEDEGFVFGLSIKDDWHLIGNVYVFLYSLTAMLEMRKEHSPIIDTKGENKGTLVYSIEPIVYDENGEALDMVNSIYDMLGRNITVEVCIHKAQGIPEKWSTNVFTEYKWIDIDGRTFRTEYSEDKKNKNPQWEYRHLHDIMVSHELVEHIKESALVMSVYGKLSPEEIENLYEEFALDPSKNALLANKMDVDSEEERKEITEANSNKSTHKIVEGESKEIRDLKKQLEDLKKKNSKLKKEKVNLIFY